MPAISWTKCISWIKLRFCKALIVNLLTTTALFYQILGRDSAGLFQDQAGNAAFGIVA